MRAAEHEPRRARQDRRLQPTRVGEEDEPRRAHVDNPEGVDNQMSES